MDPQEKILRMFSTHELAALLARIEFLLSTTTEASCIPVYIAALAGLRSELAFRLAEHDEFNLNAGWTN
jgi:hypothetical protein